MNRNERLERRVLDAEVKVQQMVDIVVNLQQSVVHTQNQVNRLITLMEQQSEIERLLGERCNIMSDRIDTLQARINNK